MLTGLKKQKKASEVVGAEIKWTFEISSDRTEIYGKVLKYTFSHFNSIMLFFMLILHPGPKSAIP